MGRRYGWGCLRNNMKEWGGGMAELKMQNLKRVKKKKRKIGSIEGLWARYGVLDIRMKPLKI